MLAYLSTLVRFIDDAEIAGLLIAAGIILFVGNKISHGMTRTRGFCLSVAGIALIGYMGFHFHDGSSALGEQAFRGLLAAGIVLGALWIVTPALVSIYQGITGTLGGWKRSFFGLFNRGLDSMRYAREARRGEALFAESELEGRAAGHGIVRARGPDGTR